MAELLGPCIHKYPLDIKGKVLVDMPMGATPLYVGTQDGSPYIWAEVFTTMPMVKHSFYVVGTGYRLSTEHGTYLGTFMLANDSLVFHVYDGREE